LIDNHIHERAPSQLLVQSGGGEIHIAGHILTWFDRRLAEQVFSTPALMSRNHMLVSVIILYCLLQPVEIIAASVRFVPHHHTGPLTVAHGASAAVCEQVNVDIRGTQQEGFPGTGISSPAGYRRAAG